MCRSAEVRTAALYAVNVYISCELKELPDETLLTEQSLKCAEDGSVLVRTELLILLARFVERCAVARWRNAIVHCGAFSVGMPCCAHVWHTHLFTVARTVDAVRLRLQRWGCWY